MCEDNDDIPQLSEHTFTALQEFYREQELQDEIEQLQRSNGANCTKENWQLSQFWYDDQTVEDLVKVAVNSVEASSKIALISCPTLYSKMKEKFSMLGEVTLFEYDQRFLVYGTDFIHYDYNDPLGIPAITEKHYDLVIADPPFLSEECLTKTATTIKFLAKDKIIVCTGAIMQDLVEQLLGLNKNSLKPRHKNNLANEFFCYSNFRLDEIL